ncbi:MAG: hypothetical protein QW521_02255 [Desulfurococcaceae archaeon]
MSESAYYDWKTPIRSLVLKENMNFAFIFPVDVRWKPTFEFYFFRVMRVHPLKRVYVLPEISPGAIQDFTYLGETKLGEGDDIFLMSEEKPYRILHFGIGVYPENIMIWRQQPAEYTLTGWSRRIPTKAGDPIDYFTGRDSPFNEPTRISETYMWYKGSLYLAYKNDEPIAVTPKLHILGAGYDTCLLDDKALADKFIRGILPCRFLSVGGLAEIRYTVPEEWKGKGFEYSLREVQSLIRG